MQVLKNFQRKFMKILVNQNQTRLPNPKPVRMKAKYCCRPCLLNHQNPKGNESFTNKPANERSSKKPSEKDTAPEWGTARSMTGEIKEQLLK
jgi:hypothetical protein